MKALLLPVLLYIVNAGVNVPKPVEKELLRQLFRDGLFMMKFEKGHYHWMHVDNPDIPNLWCYKLMKSYKSKGWVDYHYWQQWQFYVLNTEGITAVREILNLDPEDLPEMRKPNPDYQPIPFSRPYDAYREAMKAERARGGGKGGEGGRGGREGDSGGGRGGRGGDILKNWARSTQQAKESLEDEFNEMRVDGTLVTEESRPQRVPKVASMPDPEKVTEAPAETEEVPALELETQDNQVEYSVLSLIALTFCTFALVGLKKCYDFSKQPHTLQQTLLV